MVTNIREMRTGSCEGTFLNSIPEDSSKIGIVRVCILNLILERRLNHFSKVVLCITGEPGLESGFNTCSVSWTHDFSNLWPLLVGKV